MSDVRARYPALDSFLASEFIQDSQDARSLAEVVADFRQTNGLSDTLRVAEDIQRFLHDQHNAIDQAFDALHPQVNPAGYGYSTAAWLFELAALLERED